jgi:hypothetical protein
MRLNFCVLKNNKPAVELFQSLGIFMYFIFFLCILSCIFKLSAHDLGADDLTVKEGWYYYRIPRHGIEELAQPNIVTKFNS